MTSVPSHDLRNLARFRHAMRRFLRASEEAARAAGLTPQNHQLLLGVAGFNGTGSATIGELAEFLQVRHHSAVGLVDRAEALGYVRRRPGTDDRREVRVFLTADGMRRLRVLADQHRRELAGMRRGFNLAALEDQGSRPSRGTARQRKRPPRD
ncbi:MarR family transcriptional regulator [Candidatus Binatia bacterium]|nr:MarR family transcriptional regulator [Candidatus Binatia bacterium]